MWFNRSLIHGKIMNSMQVLKILPKTAILSSHQDSGVCSGTLQMQFSQSSCILTCCNDDGAHPFFDGLTIVCWTKWLNL